ncbi:hypothetical protein QBC32DRAFT_386791 [Pseudoneurospora amorphoporcata]|uniref:Uncharacterized protein n=1 Tax=Pseudoneurospora amorphoporcata TaxID=241081 RepID=A0AAN6SHR8_9PEZI|nr:hypothetical protein QBC32DRAFT_386791 [Pseudoneurospora amorphoporcata]
MDAIGARIAQGVPYLATEIHLIISGFLEDDAQWDTLAVLSRSSNRLRSIYEPRLYLTTKHTNYLHHNPMGIRRKDPAPGSSNPIKALMWGIVNESVPVMAQAKAYEADVNARVWGCHGKDTTCTYYGASMVQHYGFGTMLQHAVQRGLERSVEWLIQAGAVITPGLASVKMCECATYYNDRDDQCSTIHLALCKGYLGAAKLIMDHLGAAALTESQRNDRSAILQTAMRMAIDTGNIGFLSTMLEYPSLRQLVDTVNRRGRHTLLQEALSRASGRSHEFVDITGMDIIVATLVEKGKASLGPYPAGSIDAGLSPLLDVLALSDYKMAQHLLRLGCDPDGKPGVSVNPFEPFMAPLHWLVFHEIENRFKNPEWVNGGFDDYRGARSSKVSSPFVRTARAKELIEALLRHGASLMLKGGHLNSTPLKNAISHGAPFLPPSHRVAAYKLLKLMLKHAKEGKITEDAREEARHCMERIKQDVRAEHALYNLSDRRASLSSWVGKFDLEDMERMGGMIGEER